MGPSESAIRGSVSLTSSSSFGFTYLPGPTSWRVRIEGDIISGSWTYSFGRRFLTREGPNVGNSLYPTTGVYASGGFGGLLRTAVPPGLWIFSLFGSGQLSASLVCTRIES